MSAEPIDAMPHRAVLPTALMGKKLPALLLAYQRRVFRAIQQHDVVIVPKSRRIGITWGVAPVAALMAAPAVRPMDALYSGTSLDMAREFIDAAAMWTRALSIAAGAIAEGEEIFDGDADRRITSFRIQFASGKEIKALPSTPRAFRGRQGLAIIDEAAFHDNLDEMLKAAGAMLIWGGKLVIISSHNGTDNAFNQLIQDSLAGRLPYHVEGPITFTDAVADGLYRRVCLVSGQKWTKEGEATWVDRIVRSYGEHAAEELFCVPAHGEGAYLSLYMIERRTAPDIPVFRWEDSNEFAAAPADVRRRAAMRWCEENLVAPLAAMPTNLDSYCGVDFARVADLSSIWPAQVGQDLVRRPPFIVEMRNIPHEEQRFVLWFILDRLPRFRRAAMDAAGNGSWLAEITAQHYGWSRVIRVGVEGEGWQAWWRDHMPKWRAAFEDGLTALPRDADVVTDHRAIRVVNGVAQLPGVRQADARGMKRHGDTAVAHFLCYIASLSPVADYAYTPAVDLFGVAHRWPDRRSDWARSDDGRSGFRLRQGAF